MESLVKNGSNELAYQSIDVMIELASTLQRFCEEKRLVTNFTDRKTGEVKKFANCEAWQFAGTCLGLVSVCTELECLSDANEIKYKAVVCIYNKNNQIVSKGFAICSNREKLKQYFEEYAIASMAQTRAIGKAYRLLIGWVMKAAGFEATPSEEMEKYETMPNEKQPQKQPTASKETQNQMNELLKEIKYVFSESEKEKAREYYKDFRQWNQEKLEREINLLTKKINEKQDILLYEEELKKQNAINK